MQADCLTSLDSWTRVLLRLSSLNRRPFRTVMSDPPIPETASQPLPPAPPAVNRRTSLRRRTRASSKGICRKGTLGLGPNIALALVDVSETGACLRVKEALRVGQEVEVCLQATGNVREIRLTGRVVWVRPASEGSQSVGIHFDKPLSFSAVQDLGQQSSL